MTSSVDSLLPSDWPVGPVASVNVLSLASVAGPSLREWHHDRILSQWPSLVWASTDS